MFRTVQLLTNCLFEFLVVEYRFPSYSYGYANAYGGIVIVFAEFDFTLSDNTWWVLW